MIYFKAILPAVITENVFRRQYYTRALSVVIVVDILIFINSNGPDSSENLYNLKSSRYTYK